MINSNISQFLKELDAKLPNEFSTDVDDTLGMLADFTSELVDSVVEQSAPATDNVEYSKPDLCQRVSSSDSQDRTEYVAEFPIHRPQPEIAVAVEEIIV